MDKNSGINVSFVLLLLVLTVVACEFIFIPQMRFWTHDGMVPADLEPDKDAYLPAEETICYDYHITQEFYKYFPDNDLDAIGEKCIAMGGRLVLDNREYSCYWDPALFYIDCDSNAINAMTDFCENNLLSNYVCDSDIAFMGCLCRMPTPGPFNPAVDEEDDEEDDEVEKTIGQYCTDLGYDHYWDHEGDGNCYQAAINYCTPTASSYFYDAEKEWCCYKCEDDYQPITCYDTYLPMYGDLGAVCALESCYDGYNCDHYWDYYNGEHLCACTETTFCGQYCYTYLYNQGCECPPNSEQVWNSMSDFMCVPFRHWCLDGEIMEEVGPFQE